MICPYGKGRMAVLARFLCSGSVPQNLTDGRLQTHAAPIIYEDLREADESNLLNEEDMDVFGLNPMTDPLHLVCCNACKKPLKASQYVAHSELCKSLTVGKDSESNGNTRIRKPTKKAKKILLPDSNFYASNQGQRIRSDSSDSSLPQLNGQRDPPFLCMDTKGKASRNDKGAFSENACHRSSAKPVPIKRLKIISRQMSLQVNGSLAAPGVAKSSNSLDAISYKDVYSQSSMEISSINDTDANINCQEEGNHYAAMRNCVAAPLATKIYYSQKYARLRSSFPELCNGIPKECRNSPFFSDQLVEQNGKLPPQMDQTRCVEVGLQAEGNSSTKLVQFSHNPRGSSTASYPKMKKNPAESSSLEISGKTTDVSPQQNGSVSLFEELC